MFYGRENELKQLSRAINSNRAELGIVYGRRRVGKSELLRRAVSHAKKPWIFEALEGASTKKQINHFLDQLATQTKSLPFRARDWRDVFDTFTSIISKGSHYVVFDELPWMACGRGELISLLKFYWDNHWKKNPGVTLVLCGSIASFMLKHVVHSKALHNRKTFEIQLPPLPASEAKLFFHGMRSDHEVAKFLMVFGGIPKYLEQVDPGQSLAQNLDHLCFSRNGFFRAEFETIFKEQFKVAKTYESIVRALSEESCSQEILARKIDMKPGGGLTSYISTLEHAKFLRIFASGDVLGKKSNTRKIVLWDEWLRFYFTYIAPNTQAISMNTEPGLFEQLTASSFSNYCGLAFERMCLKNFDRILAKLEIPLHSVMGVGPYFRQPPRGGKPDQGLQIDILLRRKGQVLTIFECKFSSRPVGLSVVEEVKRKEKLLNAKRSYSIERVLICANEVTAPLANAGYFHQILDLDAVL
ncbi:MAG: ATP-binding protein [Proteobacteria bacterium]|nr:ATP-binding protein [Pseudomonadota bacterium]